MNTARKKILILASTFPRWKDDNQPQFVLDFAANLSQHHDVIVLAPFEKGSRLRETIGAIKVYRFPYTFPGTEKLAYRGGMVNAFRESVFAKVQLPIFLAAEFIWSYWLVATKRVDIINAHWLFPQGFVAGAIQSLSRAKLVITTHGGDVEILKRPSILRLLKRSLASANAVTFVSRRNLDRAREFTGLASEKWSVLPMGINVPPENKNHKHVGVEVLFLGRLVDIKGVDYLIRGVSQAHREGVNLHLDILGDGPARPRLVALAKELELESLVTFNGFIGGEEKSRYLADADIVVVSSITDEMGNEEGLPVAALEAMANGKILIATKTGSLPELLQAGGGILVEQKDADAICSAIQSIVAKPELASTIGDAARRKAGEFEWPEIIKKFDNILEGVQV